VKLTRRAKIVIWVLSGMLAYGAGSAWADTLTRDPEVRIRKLCLQQEDTAGHLKLIDYSGELVKYGCYRKGF
jgi:hypothetical protein